MTWKPREEYKTLVEFHKPILTRMKDGYVGPMVCIWHQGHFYPCPGAPIFFGTHECGWWTHDDFDEWMEIPE
jgi:hypothetical protein